MKATVTSKGQITIPKAIREKLNIRSGDVLDFDENAAWLVARKGIPEGAFERMRKQMLQGGKNPFAGMSVAEAVEEMRCPVELPEESCRLPESTGSGRRVNRAVLEEAENAIEGRAAS